MEDIDGACLDRGKLCWRKDIGFRYHVDLATGDLNSVFCVAFSDR